MKIAVALTLTVGFSFLASTALADTQQLSITAYGVQTKLPEKVPLPNGKSVMVGGVSQSSLVNDKTGEVTSQWCNGDEFPDAKGAVMASVGHCTVFYDNGDVVWISYSGGAVDQPGKWTVIGGTGKYAGATGSGTFTNTSQRGDGYAGTQKSTGTLTTK
jgi:hypothetical protein